MCESRVGAHEMQDLLFDLIGHLVGDLVDPARQRIGDTERRDIVRQGPHTCADPGAGFPAT